MDIEARLIEAADRAALHDLIVLYAKGRDTTEPAIYREIFAPDATVGIGDRVLSHDLSEILTKVEGDKARFNPDYAEGRTTWAKMLHEVSNVLIRVDGDTATGEYYVKTIAYNEAKKRPELLSVAHNTDAYERRDKRWWIVRSVIGYGWEGEELGKALQVGRWTPPQYRR
ncbi:MAG: nuclear transport factor 2 family protein [Microbacterium sp.]|uniref:nuclear transport factor 2 family protein n=1 Tax=Microbacterium sp. TaxID=51671 RepID=UPI0039E689D5